MNGYPDRNCLQCGNRFDQKRADHFFCSGACCAAYYRDNPNPDYIHKELPHDKPHVCEECGQPYNVNGYAERGGKRANRFCSPKCKQKTWRSAQKQAKRRYEEANAKKENSEKQWEDTQKQWQNSSRDQKRAEEEFWRKWNENRGHSGEQARRRAVGKTGMTVEAAISLLGLSQGFTQEMLKKAYRAKAAECHPDRCKLPNATELMQRVNAAYEVLKR